MRSRRHEILGLGRRPERGCRKRAEKFREGVGTETSPNQGSRVRFFCQLWQISFKHAKWSGNVRIAFAGAASSDLGRFLYYSVQIDQAELRTIDVLKLIKIIHPLRAKLEMLLTEQGFFFRLASRSLVNPCQRRRRVASAGNHPRTAASAVVHHRSKAA